MIKCLSLKFQPNHLHTSCLYQLQWEGAHYLECTVLFDTKDSLGILELHKSKGYGIWPAFGILQVNVNYVSIFEKHIFKVSLPDVLGQVAHVDFGFIIAIIFVIAHLSLHTSKK